MDYCQVSQPNSQGVRAMSHKCHTKNNLEENTSSLIKLWSNFADSRFVVYLMVVGIFLSILLFMKQEVALRSGRRSLENTTTWNSLKIKPDKSIGCYYLLFILISLVGFEYLSWFILSLGLFFSRSWTSLYLKTKDMFKKQHFFNMHLWNEDRHF